MFPYLHFKARNGCVELSSLGGLPASVNSSSFTQTSMTTCTCYCNGLYFTLAPYMGSSHRHRPASLSHLCWVEVAMKYMFVRRKTLPEDCHFKPEHPAMQARAAYMASASSDRPPAPWGLALRPRETVPVFHTERGIGNTALFGEHLDAADIDDDVKAKRQQYASLMLLLFCPFTSKDDLKCGLDTWDPWACFLHATATGALRPLASEYLKNIQLFHVRFLRRQSDLVPLPGVPHRAPANDGDDTHDDLATNVRDEMAFAELHARSNAAAPGDHEAHHQQLLAGRANNDPYADPASTQSSVKRNEVFASRQDSALQNPATRDLLLRPGTLTDTLLCPAPSVKQQLVHIQSWAQMLTGGPADDVDVVMDPPEDQETRHDPETAARSLRLRVEIAHCFQGGSADATPAQLLSIDEVRQ